MGLAESPWQAVVSAALVGTDRQPFVVPTAAGKLGQILPQLSHQSTEAALLNTAALLSLRQQAGWVPEHFPLATQAPCELNDLPRCSPRAARFLQQMLQGQYAPVLPEWLAITAQSNQRVPELSLPELLDMGRQRRDLRAAILPVLGQRGRWLAAQNPDWSYAVEVAAEEDWETSSPAAQLLYLQDLRSHDPDRARTLLQTTWKQETASDRAKFLETLRTRLSMADEPFLEDVLGDRSKDVRRIAADLLASLPNSRLCQRMEDRLKQHVSFKKKGEFEVSLPQTCDAEMQRDGIELKPRSSIGERAWWLQQIISATPLNFWEQSESAEIAELIKITKLCEWKNAFLNGWQIATKRQSNEIWAKAFLSDPQDIFDDQLELLFNALTAKQRQEFAIQLIQAQRDDKHDDYLWRILGALAQEPCYWRDELAHLIPSIIERASPYNTGLWHWKVKEALQTIPLRISPQFLLQAPNLHRIAETSFFSESTRLFLEILQFRQEMKQAFEIKTG